MASTIGFPNPENERQVRCNLLGRYFMPWAQGVSMRIVKEGLEEKFAYIDLAAGELDTLPEDSPCYVALEWASRQRTIRPQLYPLFNESDTEKAAQWSDSLKSLPRLEHFTFVPQLHHSTIDNALRQMVASVRALPTLLSADLCSNEGLTWEWLRELVQQHRADCLLWVDYQRLSGWVKRQRDQDQLHRVLGEQAANALKETFKKRLRAPEKAAYWKALLEERLLEVLGADSPGLLCFTFYDAQDKLVRWLYFLTNNPTAYTAMREVMNGESQLIEDGIGNHAYAPSQGARRRISSPTLFGPMFELEQHLLATYRNQTIQLIDLYEEQHWGRSLTKNNYIDALLNLEEKQLIKITRKRAPRGRTLPKGHLPDKTFLSFKPQQVG